MQNQIAVIIPVHSSAVKRYYKNLRQIKQDVLAEDMEWMRKIVFCVLRLKENLGPCIFVIVICR